MYETLAKRIEKLEARLAELQQPPNEKFIHLLDLADMLKINKHTIYNAISKGTFFLQDYRIMGRIYFKRSELEKATKKGLPQRKANPKNDFQLKKTEI